MELKTKEEVIREAWGEYYEELKEFIDENGWLPYGYRGSYGDKNPASLGDMYRYCGGEENTQTKNTRNKSSFRPKSLRGIDDNNGWTIIDENTPMPDEDATYFVFDDDGDIGYFDFWLGFQEYQSWQSLREKEGITHFQLEVKPKPPIHS